MKLFKNILSAIDHWNNYDTYYSNTEIDKTDVAVLLISMLHLEGKINDDKLNAMFASLRKKTFLRGINTHYCKINSKWYSDTDMFSIIMDVYSNMTLTKEMTLDMFLKYLNKYHNKNKNFCLDVMYFNYIEPLIDNLDTYPHYQILKGFDVLDGEVLSYEDADNKYSLGQGHCCEDCDGDYEQYKQSRYEYYYKNDMIKTLKTKSKVYLLNLKTHQKNPIDRLKTDMQS